MKPTNNSGKKTNRNNKNISLPKNFISCKCRWSIGCFCYYLPKLHAIVIRGVTLNTRANNHCAAL